MCRLLLLIAIALAAPALADTTESSPAPVKSKTQKIIKFDGCPHFRP